MSAAVFPPVVADDEQLARFVLYERWLRKSDRTVKPEAFMPPPNGNLSVTRRLRLSDPELWRIGQAVAEARPAKLYGRADICADKVREVRQSKLDVVPSPLADNPHHAEIIGWPRDKPAQKIIAQQLAAAAIFTDCGEPSMSA